MQINYQSLGVTYNPLHKVTNPTSEEIDSDVATISKENFNALRTYYPQANGSIGLQPIFEKHQIHALLGLFIFSDHLDWTDANYSDYIKPHLDSSYLTGVLVGNEDFGADVNVNNYILKYLKQIKVDNSKVPVGTAQKTDFWMNNIQAQQVANLSDFIGVNIYPAWEWQNPDSENQPLNPNANPPQSMTPDQALSSVQKQYQDLKDKYPGKQIVLTESGWPTTYGWVVNVPSQPHQYKVGLDNAAEFTQKLKQWAQNQQIVSYYYSMFDDWYGVDTSSQFNFHFGLLNTNDQKKIPTTELSREES